MPVQNVETENIDVGPADCHFQGNYLGRTNDETTFAYSVEYFDIETEEDGRVDQSVSNDEVNVEVPLAYTDPETLSQAIPWAELVEDGSGNKKLKVGGAIGEKMSTYAGELVIHPRMKPDSDKSKDVTIHKCYPAPQEIEFGYAREGQRQATIEFVALKDANGEYFTIGDPDITSA